MTVKQNDSEKLILKAAEAEFLEKGYGKARTTEIAKRAGINHAMLHYYFRTKENLFEMIFKEKIKLMVEVLFFTFSQDLPFFEKVKKGVADHFDFVAANNRLPNFIFSEIMHDDKLKNIFINMVKERIGYLLRDLTQEIEMEVTKGTITYVEPYDLLYNIVSLNVFTFLSAPIIPSILGVGEEQLPEFLEHRKQMNVDIILKYLKP